jgi:hypothetical protein
MRMLFAAVFAVLAPVAYAGGVSEPVLEPTVTAPVAAGPSNAGLIIAGLLLGGLLIAAADSGSGSH